MTLGEYIMRKIIAIAVAGTAIFPFVGTPVQGAEMPKWFQEYLDQADRDSKKYGPEAIEICKKVMHLSNAVKTIYDVWRIYGVKKSDDFTECVLDAMRTLKQ